MARDALPRGAQRGAARGAAPRRARVADGRGHRRVRRRLQGHRRAARGVRRAARARHADLREHDRRHGRRRGDDRAAPGRRADDDQLRAARVRPDRQPRGAHPLHVRRPGARAAGRAHAAGRGPPARPDALALPGGAVPARARACSSPCPSTAGRREGPAEDARSATRTRSSSSSTSRSTACAARCPRTRTTSSASAARASRREGSRRDDRRHLAHGASRPSAPPRRWPPSTASRPR